MIQFPIQAQPRTFRQANVSNAADTTLYTCPAAGSSFLDTLKVCNKTAGAVTFDAWWSDGSTTDYLYKGKSVAANDTFLQGSMAQRFAAGDVLKIRASAVTSLDISATFTEIHKNT